MLHLRPFLFFFSTKITYAQLINEFSSAAGTSSDPDYPDWVEVYFDSGLDPSLYQLKDGSNNTKNLSEATCSGGVCVVDWSNRLTNTGDTIKLVLISSPDSNVDQITYGGDGNVCVPDHGFTIGRVAGVNSPYSPTNVWERFSTSSKGKTNNNGVISPCPAPTPIPTNTPTNTPAPTNTSVPNTPTPTPKPTATLTPTIKPTPRPTTVPKDYTAENEKLREEADVSQFRYDANNEEIDKGVLGVTSDENNNKISPFAYVLLGLGVVSIGVSAFFFLKNRKQTG